MELHHSATIITAEVIPLFIYDALAPKSARKAQDKYLSDFNTWSPRRFVQTVLRRQIVVPHCRGDARVPDQILDHFNRHTGAKSLSDVRAPQVVHCQVGARSLADSLPRSPGVVLHAPKRTADTYAVSHKTLDGSHSPCGQRRDAGLDALDGLIAYLRPRVAMTDYVDFRAHGLVIGSGIMESTCKQLVGQRLNGSGRQWSEGGAVAMSALIAQRINQSSDAFWASRPIHRAA